LNRADLLKTTPIKELVQSKWNKYLQRVFYTWLFIYVIYLVIFSIVVIQPPFLMNGIEPTTAMNVLELIVLCFSTTSVLLELRDWIVQGKYYILEKSSRFFCFIAWVNSTLVWLAFVFRLVNLRVAFFFFLFPFPCSFPSFFLTRAYF